MRHTTYIGPNVMYSENLHNRLLVDMLRSLVITHSQRFFDRRVERVVWSPRSRSTLAVGSHGGDVYLWNYENELRTSKIVDGCGKGGAINDMKFSQEGDRLYAVGHDGHITAHDTETAVAIHSFGTKSFGSVPKPGNCCDHWFTGLAGCEKTELGRILASDNLGFVASFDTTCKLQTRWKLHKSKVSSVDVCPLDHNIVSTTSIDRTCCLWDIRYMKSAGSADSLCKPLVVQTFDGAVTAAQFSRNGRRLLVTSQDNCLRVCKLSASSQGISLVGACQQQVSHPHRFYQHMTQHRGSFHPRSDDLFIIGRFPAKDATGQAAERGLDVYSTASGSFVLRLGVSWPGIQAGAAAIRADGEAIASMSGHTVLVYTHAPQEEAAGSSEKQQKSVSDVGGGGSHLGTAVPNLPGPRPWQILAVEEQEEQEEQEVGVARAKARCVAPRGRRQVVLVGRPRN